MNPRMSEPEKVGAEPSYSQAQARLDEILEYIESGKVDIDELSTLVEEAASLVTLCRKKLTAAEMRVRQITERLEREAEQGPPQEGPFPGEESGEEGEVPF